MREIAAEAGFANGGLKHYFATKDDLLVAAFQRTFYRVNERAGLATGGRPHRQRVDHRSALARGSRISVFT